MFADLQRDGSTDRDTNINAVIKKITFILNLSMMKNNMMLAGWLTDHV